MKPNTAEKYPFRELGQLLKRVRVKKGLKHKNILSALRKNETYRKMLYRFEIGGLKPDRSDLLDLVVVGLSETTPKGINRFLKLADYELVGPDDLAKYGLSLDKAEPQPQKVRWGPVDDRPAGILIDGPERVFVPWSSLKDEIEHKLLNQLGRHLPAHSRAVLCDFRDRKDWRVRVENAQGNRIADVWFGPDPDTKWAFDGLVRVGVAKTDHVSEVWQVFQRYSDGSYRRLVAKENPVPSTNAGTNVADS